MNGNILNALKTFDTASALHAFTGWGKGEALGFVASGEDLSVQFIKFSKIITPILCSWLQVPTKTWVGFAKNWVVLVVVSRGGEALHNKIHSLFTYRFMSSENLTRVIAVATGIAIAVLSNPYYGAGILSSVLYEIADSHGLVPRKISLLVETYLGPLAKASHIVFDKRLIMRVVGFSYLGCALVPGLRPFIQHYVDGMIPDQETKLEEYEAPLQDNKKMSCENIAKLLTGQAAAFSIDPAHCSKMVSDSAVLLKDQDFTKLLNHFNQITDTLTYESLIKDESFSNSLRKKFPEENQRPSNDDLRAWMSQELDTLVKTLRGDLFYRIKGRQSELQDAIDNVAKIIPFLESMKKEEKIDCFLKLLGGREGAHELKKATSNVLNDLLKKPLYNEGESISVKYERSIRATFQEKRFKIFQDLKALNKPKNLECSFDLIEKGATFIYLPFGFDPSLSFDAALSLGFLPRTSLEREDVSILEKITSSTIFAKVRKEMLREYESTIQSTMETAIANAGGSDQLIKYLKELISSNDNLNPENKQKIQGIIEDKANRDEMEMAFFVLVYLGILKEG